MPASERFRNVAPGDLESLLPAEVLQKFMVLPKDHQEALRAYIVFGVPADVVPMVVEQKMAQWGDSPIPLPDLLGPEAYLEFEKKIAQGRSGSDFSPYPDYARFLLFYYVYVAKTQPDLEDKKQAFLEFSKGYAATTQAQRAQIPQAPVPDFETIFPPIALAKLGQLGPKFQSRVRQLAGTVGVLDIVNLTNGMTLTEVMLLKVEPGLELPGIESSLTDIETSEFAAFPAEIQERLQNLYSAQILGLFRGLAFEASSPILSMPEESKRSERAKRVLEQGRLMAGAAKNRAEASE